MKLNSKTLYNLSYSHLATWLFLAPIFLQRVFIGGSGDSYADYPGFSLYLIGYFSNFGLIVLALNSSNNKYLFNHRFVLMLLSLILLSFVQLFLSSKSLGLSAYELALPLVRGWLWMIAIICFFVCFFERKIFVKIFFKACKISFIIMILCLIFYLLTNIAFGIHISYGYPRVQGFFSEPSALAIVAPAFLLYSIFSKNIIDFIITLLIIIASGSVIVYGVSLLTAFIFLIRNAGWPKISELMVFICVTIVATSPYILNSENTAYLSDMATEILQNIKSKIEDDILFLNVLERFLSSLSNFSNLLSDYSASHLGNGLARFIGVLVTINDLKTDGLEFTGYGLNIYGYVAVKRYGDIVDFGFFPFLLSSFGVFFSAIIILFIALKARLLITDSSEIGVILITGLFATLLNSAGGFHAYSLPMLILVWVPVSALKGQYSAGFRSA